MMVDAVMDTLAAAGVGLNAVKVRSLAPEQEVVAQAVWEMLDGDEPVDAFLCRNDFYARVTSEVVAESAPPGRSPRCIASGGHGTADSSQGFQRIVSAMGLGEQVELLAEMLVEATTSLSGQPRTVTVPVILRE
jgi:hypothetical protein